jgi:GNAT superfamily N-acetyltransferase
MAEFATSRSSIGLVPLPRGRFGEFKMVGCYDSSHQWVGVALISVHGGACILWNIVVLQTHRRKGYGSDIILGLQKLYDEITTSWYSDEGRLLCLKMGFEVKAPTNERAAPSLVWTRP